MNDQRTERLRRAIGNLKAADLLPPHVEPESIDLAPKTAHEAITRQMVTDLAADVGEIKNRVNALLWLIAGTVVAGLVMRLAGVG